MKHYSTEQWADFIREVMPLDQGVAMEAHLRSGCNECLREAAVWGRVREVAAREAIYTPPDFAVRVARSLQVARQPRPVTTLGTMLAELIWDSRREFVLAGVRTLSASPQQMLYRAGDFAIDMRIEPIAGGSRFVVVGQILNSARPDEQVRDIPVAVEMEGRAAGTGRTNDHGEFRVEFDGGSYVRLRVALGSEADILIPVGAVGADSR